MKGCMNEIPHVCIPDDNPVFWTSFGSIQLSYGKGPKKKKMTTQMKSGAGIGSVI